jgi:multidrug efflux pump subunit AcrA (membrane-fusion protein)
VGEMASTQTPIATIGASNDFYIEMHVDEFDITKIKIGQKVLLSLDSYKGKSFEAEITKVYPIMDEKTKTFKVEASFKVVPENLFPNLSAEANIVIETKNNALTIPSNYITENTFVLLKNKEKRKIEIGLKDYEKTEVLSGLSIKDEIVKPQ